MSRRIRRHLSFANIASLCALVFAISGTSYALTIPKNSIGSGHIKEDGVARSDIRGDAVASGEVKNRSLRAVDFANGQLPAGPRGLSGAQGRPGVVGAITVQRSQAELNDGTHAAVQAHCPAGTRIIAGGADVDPASSDDIKLMESRPTNAGGVPSIGGTFDEWHNVYRNPTGGTGAATMRAYAICVQT